MRTNARCSRKNASRDANDVSPRWLYVFKPSDNATPAIVMIVAPIILAVVIPFFLLLSVPAIVIGLSIQVFKKIVRSLI